jgi:L-threonylcarbamoyladenylate synthase
MKILDSNDQKSAEIAAEFLKNNEVIVFPTDTVYGLAVDASSQKGIENLYKIKARDKNKPIAVFVKNLDQAREILLFNDLANKIAEKFLPGALTIILKMKETNKFNISKDIANDKNFLGFRYVKTNFIDNLFKNFDSVIAVTSANKSGFEASRNSEEVIKYFTDEIDLIVANQIDYDQNFSKNLPSTVIEISDSSLKLIREGEIKFSQIQEII